MERRLNFGSLPDRLRDVLSSIRHEGAEMIQACMRQFGF